MTEATTKDWENYEPEIIRIKAENLEYERNAQAQKDWEDLYVLMISSLPLSMLDKAELENKLEAVQKQSC